MTTRFRAGAVLPLLLMTTLLTACGLQLRGKANIASDLTQLSVTGKDHTFTRELRKALSTTGIEVTDSAPYVLALTELDQHTGEISQASANQYERLLTLSATYQLKTRDDLNLFEPMQLSNERYVYQNKNQMNAAMTEEDRAFEELRRDLIMSTVRRIAAVSNEALNTEEERARKVRAEMLKALESQP